MVNIFSYRCMVVRWCYRRNLDGLGFSLRLGFGRTCLRDRSNSAKNRHDPPSSVLTILSRLPFRLCMTKPIVFLWHTIFEKLSYKPLYTAYHIIEFPFPTTENTVPVRFFCSNLIFTDLLWCIKIVWLLSNHIVLYHIVSYHIALHCIASHRIVLYQIVLCCNIGTKFKMNFTSKVHVKVYLGGLKETS